MALFNYVQGWFLSYWSSRLCIDKSKWLLRPCDSMFSSQYLKVLQTRILPISPFLHDFLFEKKNTTHYILSGHFTFFKMQILAGR